MTYLDVWRSGTFPGKQQVSQCTSDREHGPQNDWALDIRQSWWRFLDSESRFTAVQKECATPPHVQVRHTTWLSFTRPSLALILQATNAGARRPGYEAITYTHLLKSRWWARGWRKCTLVFLVYSDARWEAAASVAWQMYCTDDRKRGQKLLMGSRYFWWKLVHFAELINIHIIFNGMAPASRLGSFDILA